MSESPSIKKSAASGGTIVTGSAAAKSRRDKPSHPPTSKMVNSSILALKNRNGSSLQAIKKYISANYGVDAEKMSSFIKKYIKNAVASGVLIQTSGKGASGSFKLAKKKKIPKNLKSAVAEKTEDTNPKCSSCLKHSDHLTTICGSVGNLTTTDLESLSDLYRLVQTLADPQEWLDDNNYSICAACKVTLRDILDFRKQLRDAQYFCGLLKNKNASNSCVSDVYSISSNMESSSSTAIDTEIEPVTVKLEPEEDCEDRHDVSEFAMESECIIENDEHQENSIKVENDNSYTGLEPDQYSLHDSRSIQEELVPEPSLVQVINQKKDEYEIGFVDMNFNYHIPDSTAISPGSRKVAQSDSAVVEHSFDSSLCGECRRVIKSEEIDTWNSQRYSEDEDSNFYDMTS